MKPLRALLLTGALLGALPAVAQVFPPPPPPPAGPPGPPPRRRAVPYFAPPPVANNVARLSLGFAFANDSYDCWYPGYVGGFGGGCGYGYGYAWPNVNAEVDLGLSPYLAVSLGGNVFWGGASGVDNTVWEPHLDLLLRSTPYAEARGRLRIGLGIYVAHASSGAVGILGAPADDTGAALRLGAGISFFNRSAIGLGIDGIFEAGSIGGFYVSTFQLLVGPELHF